jgi:hypothetical protein
MLKATTKADQLAWSPQGVPPPEAALPGTWAAQAGQTQARQAQDIAVQAATMAARRSMRRGGRCGEAVDGGEADDDV